MKVIPSIAFNELSTSCFSLLSLDNVCEQPLFSLKSRVLRFCRRRNCTKRKRSHASQPQSISAKNEDSSTPKARLQTSLLTIHTNSQNSSCRRSCLSTR
ncbi:MAG: hypothetical protein ACI3ZT_09710 [Candidatus Cryptobacteroides sp.]